VTQMLFKKDKAGSEKGTAFGIEEKRPDGADRSEKAIGQSSDSKSKISFKSNIVNRLRPRIREFRNYLRIFRKNPLGIVGLALILTIVIIAIAAPFLAPPLTGNAQPDPIINRFDLAPPKPPGSPGVINGQDVTYIWGTGQSGEDIYYGTIWGARTSIYIALAIVGLAAIIGVAVGAVAGFYGGILDEVLMRTTDVFLSIPSLILALGIVAILGKSLEFIILALVITWWPSYARLIRGQVLAIKESTYVEAARAIGAKKNRILFRHIVPNTISPLTVSITMDFGTVVLVAAALSFIGFSTPGLCEWGRMVSAGSAMMFSQIPYPFPSGPFYNPYWAWVFPAGFIFMFVMGFSLLGDSLRDMLDPRMRR
jgi:peptide/nickel transport system permease protein